jgi:hypothetical protein
MPGALACRTGVETVFGRDKADGEKTTTYKAPSGYVLKAMGHKILERKGRAEIDSSLSKDRKRLTCRWKAAKSGRAAPKAYVKGYCTAVAVKA